MCGKLLFSVLKKYYFFSVADLAVASWLHCKSWLKDESKCFLPLALLNGLYVSGERFLLQLLCFPLAVVSLTTQAGRSWFRKWPATLVTGGASPTESDPCHCHAGGSPSSSQVLRLSTSVSSYPGLPIQPAKRNTPHQRCVGLSPLQVCQR